MKFVHVYQVSPTKTLDYTMPEETANQLMQMVKTFPVIYGRRSHNSIKKMLDKLAVYVPDIWRDITVEEKPTENKMRRHKVNTTFIDELKD